MKRKILYLFAMLCALVVQTTTARVQNPAIEGVVKNEDNVGAEFATVILTTDNSAEVAGAITDATGKFVLSAPKGDYILVIQYLGYEQYTQPIRLISGTTQIDNITLNPSTTVMQSVEVTTRLITREADRFVVNVANNPVAIGKNALEMLKVAPGVWVNDQGISINGKSGVKVIVNERIMNLSTDELNVYLKNINAEDIQKIEIIPTAGADYDADSPSGIIKITLKRQRADGIEGSIGATYMVGNSIYEIAPSANINYHSGKLSLYTNLNYSVEKAQNNARERTNYHDSPNTVRSGSRIDSKGKYYGIRLGGIYDITQRQNIGAEVYFSDFREPQKTIGTSDFMTELLTTNNNSNYHSISTRRNISATVNYLIKLDTVGSSFKLIGDFTSRKSDENNDYFNAAAMWIPTTPSDIMHSDTTYRSNSASDYNIYSATANLDLVLSPKTKLSAGVKYTYNHMDNKLLYEGLNTTSKNWEVDLNQSLRNDYSEKIGAAYAIVNTRISIVKLSAGLRGEYTYAAPRTKQQQSDNTSLTTRAKQSYFSLFPTINISIPGNKKESTMFIAAYSRKISRPGFWALNPFRMQLSEYSYISGNPSLQPTFSNSFTFTSVLAHKYSITLGADLIHNSIEQRVVRDAHNPDILMYQHYNSPNQQRYYIAANLPLTITKWWTLNANLTGINMSYRLTSDSPKKNHNMAYANATNNITLPKNFFVEVSYYYQSRWIMGNMKSYSTQNVSLSIKKRFAKERFTASVSAYNLIKGASNMRVDVMGEGFEKYTSMNENWSDRRFVFSLRYNFRSGVSFKAKSVESGSGEDANRLGGK